MQIKIVGQANMLQPSKAVAALTAEVEALNRAMLRTSTIPAGGSPQGFQQQQRAMRGANAAFNAALASSGKYRVETLKLNDVIEKQTDLLQRQKLGMRQVWGKGNRDMMKQVYQEQIRMQQSMMKTTTGGVTDGKLRATMAIPTDVHKSWDTLSQKVGFFSHQLRSASGQMVDWGKNTQWSGRQLTTGLSVPIAALGALSGVVAYQVDKQMTRIQKVYDTTANANSTSMAGQMAVEKELAQVREDAMRTGVNAAKQYGASITDTLEVQAELAATGQKGAALQKGTNEIMRISMLGEIDHATTTQALIALQSTLGMTTRETGDAFNYMNAIENATSLTMADFAEAIPRAAAPMKEMGGDVKDLGLLLVAMKERGIAAGEGANAIKAMMQRLYRPSKQIREEWQSIAGLDPLKLVEENGGDIMKILPKIADAVAGLNKQDRVKALAGLFGTYQVTRMSAMLDGLKNVEDQSSQTYRALQVAGNSADDNAKIAQREQERMMASASGRFRKALETIKAELAEIGEPFLDVATFFLEAVTKVASAFNALPKFAKKGIIAVALFTAAVGPIVMLVGLIGVLAGSLGKMLAPMLLKVAGGTDLVTKSQYAMRVAAKLAEKEFQTQGTQAKILQGQMVALTDATRLYAQTMAAANGIKLNPLANPTAAGTKNTLPLIPYVPGQNAAPPAPVPTPTPAQQQQQRPKTIMKNYHGALVPDIAANKAAEESYKRQLATNEKIASTTKARLASEAAVTAQSNAQNTIKKQTADHTTGAAVATAAMAASMGTMMVTSNETANSIAQWVMMSAILVPAMKGLAPAVSKFGSTVAGAAAAQKAAAVSALAQGSAVAKTAGKWGAVRSVVTGIGAGLAGMMGPIGWITLGIGAAGIAAYKWFQHEKKITAEKNKQSEQLTKQNDLLEKQLGIQRRDPKKISTLTETQRDGEMSSSQMAEEIKGAGTGLINSYKGGSAYEKEIIVTKEYLNILNAVGGNADKARKYVEAMFIAAGDGALKAERKAREFYWALGGPRGPGSVETESVKLWGKQVRASMDESTEAAKKTGKDIASTFGTEIVAGNADTPERLITAMQAEFKSRWSGLFDGLSSAASSAFRDAGISGGEEISKAISDYQNLDMDEFAKKYSDGDLAKLQELYLAIAEAQQLGGKEAKNLATIEKEMAGQLAKDLGIEGKILTLKQLQATEEFKLQSVTKGNANALYQVKKNEEGITEEKKLQYANRLLANAGMTQAKTLAEAEKALAAAAKKEIGGGADEANRLKTNLKDVPNRLNIKVALQGITGADMTDIQKSAMSGAQNAMADQATSAFDSRMQASLDATSASWDERIAQQQAGAERAQEKLDRKWERNRNQTERRHEKQSAGLESKWDNINTRFEKRWERKGEALENYYDKRVNAIDKAIKAEEEAEATRQRIFEAERTRMQRMAEMQNKTIDFNLSLRTGDFDQAAKIKNDMEAQVNDWTLTDAQEGSAAGTEKRVAALGEKRDKYEDEREKAQKALQRREADAKASLERRERAEKASLERRQRVEKASLEKRERAEKAQLQRVTKANADALAKQAQAAKNAASVRWQREKASFDQRIMLFKSYIARDQKDLQRWMKSVGLSYDDFGIKTKKKGENWAQAFEGSMVRHMRQAGATMASDKMWAGLGARNATEIAKGMGFPSMASFKKFISTGDMPKTFGQNLNRAPKNNNGPTDKNPANPVKNNNPVNRHKGGWTDKGSGSRHGVARTLKGTHPNEVMLRAQKGEFVVNKDAAAKNANILEAINNGSADSVRNIGTGTDSVKNVGNGVGGNAPLSGMAGILMAGMAKGLTAGMGMAMKDAVQRKKAAIDAAAAVSGVFGAGGGGTFGDRSFGAEHLKNAATIANVGVSMGMSKRDIQIAIMTAIAESGLVNVKFGDRDSQGLFQQRPSQGWGTVAQVTTPTYAARKFFEGLKGLGASRNEMSPWMAAQSVQRSAFSDGSNYQVQWNEAVAIYNKGLKKTGDKGSTFGVAGQYATGGSGGKYKPSVPGKGWSTSHDYRNGMNSPLYAFNDGRIIESRSIRSGGSSTYPGYPRGWTSYGEHVKIRANDGTVVSYSHLNPNTRVHTGPVKGGALIGRSGMTGNASGPHTHFEMNGSTNAQSLFARYGIGLSTGGYTKTDGMANLHKNEVVVDPGRTDALFAGLDKFNAVMDSVKNVGNGVGGESSPMIEGFGSGLPNFLAQNFATVGKAYYSGIRKPTKGGGGSGSGSSGSGPVGKGGNVKTGTFNAHTYGHKPVKTIADLKKVLPKVDSLALQEWTGAAGSAQKWLLNQGWGLHRGPTGTAIAWRKSKYEASKLGSWDLNKKYRMPKRTSQRHVAYGQLKDKKTGSRFWLGSAHLIPGHKYFRGAVSEGHRNAILKEQYQRMAMLRDKLDNSAPVIFGGDYNDRSRGKIKGMSSNTNGKIIDQIYSTMKGSKASIIKGLYSDHNAVLGSYNLPKLNTGGYTMTDGMAQLHKNELVIDPTRTKLLLEGIDNFASGGQAQYNVNVTLNGADVDANDLANVVVRKLKAEEARKPTARRR